MRRELRSAERLSDAAIFFALVCLKTPCFRSSASLSCVTRCDQRFGDAFFGDDFRQGGFHRLAPITDITDEEWDRVITVNLKSTFLCSRAVAATMIERKKGRIINIASGSGIAPNPYAPTRSSAI